MKRTGRPPRLAARIASVSLLAGTLAVAGCGQRGSLYLPDQPPRKPATRPAPAPVPPVTMPVPTADEPQRNQDR